MDFVAVKIRDNVPLRDKIPMIIYYIPNWNEKCFQNFRLDRYRLEALEDVNKEDKIKSTRSVEALRKSYHKEFLYQAQKTKACIECQAATKSIVFYRSRFIYEGKLDSNNS